MKTCIRFRCLDRVIFYLDRKCRISDGKQKIELSMGKEFNCDVIFHIQDLPYSYIQSQNLSALNQAVNQDTNTIIAFCIDLVLTVTTKILNVLCILFLCFSLNIEMSLIIVISSILYTLLYLVLKKKLYATRKNLRICESNFFAKLFEQLEFIYFIKTNSIESSFRKRVDDSFAKFTSANPDCFLWGDKGCAFAAPGTA